MNFHQEAQTQNFLSADQVSEQIPQNHPAAKPKKTRKRRAPGRPKCLNCGKKFFEEHELEEHNKSHRKQKRVQCSICFREMGINVLSRHMNAHACQNMYQCNQCLAQFTTIQERNNHVKKQHWDRPKIPCEICKAVCTSKSDFKNHIMSHFKRSF
uniref:C2H2-type domain-containing protein n=1 Tax=Phlebotomus papatasi TaxID=29031 RepID=A0A1B0DNK2_PHLPP